MKHAILFILSFVAFQSFAQVAIQGKVVDEDKAAIPSAVALLLKKSDSSLVKSALCDQDGQFQFSQVASGSYLISAFMVGYKKKYLPVEVADKDLELENIRLKEEKAIMQEVVVTGTKPFLEQKADKLVVNVENSATAAGATALEVLEKVPGVMVINEKINITGKSSVLILVDGRSSQYTDITQVLRDINASNIEKIEVMTNPGAKYEASGGAVINIILKKNANLGTNGTVSLMGGMGVYDYQKDKVDRDFFRLAPGITLNHRQGKWNTFGSYNYMERNQFEYTLFSRNVGPFRFDQVNYRPNDVSSHSFRAGADFYASKKNTFGVLINGFSRTGTSTTLNTTQQFALADGSTLSSFTTNNASSLERKNIFANLNWKHNFDTAGKNLEMNLDYSAFQINNNSNITNSLQDGSSYLNNQYVDNPVKLTVFKVDYEHPFDSSLKMETGIRSSFALIDNYLTFYQKGKLDPNRSTQFFYQENINAGYLNVQKTLKKWEFKAGLRAEQTVAVGKDPEKELLNRNYTQLFPTVFISRKLNGKIGLSLQYGRRIDRPSFQQQNPFVMFMDSLTYQKGNPLLRPQITDSYKMTVTYQSQPFVAVSYNKTTNVIFENAPKQEGNFTYAMPENLASFENVTFELNLPIPLGKKFSGFIHNEAVYNKYKANYLEGTFDRSQWNYLGYAQLAYKPTSNWNFEVSGYGLTDFLREFISIRPMGAMNLGVSRFLFDKKAKLTLNFNDVFYTQKMQGDIQYLYIDVKMAQRNESRNVRLSLTYNFGNQKLKETRKRSTGSESESGRVKTN